MKFFVFLVLCLVATMVNSTPMTRNKRSVMTMAGGFPFGGGAFAGAGAWPMQMPMYNPWDFTRSFMPPFPWGMVIPTRPWYNGENVCTTTKEVDDPKELTEMFAEMSPPNLDYNHESQQCQGTGSKYVCFRRYVKNGVSKMQVTKYECCLGYLRYDNSECLMERPRSGQPSGSGNQQYYFYPMQSTTSSSRSVDGVPVQ